MAKYNWLVAYGGKRWGEITQNANGELLPKPIWGFGESEQLMVSWEPFVISVGILLLNLAIWLVLLKFNILKTKHFVFITSTWFMLFVIVVTGILPYNNKWVIPVRILIVVVSYFVIFLLLNYLHNHVIANSKLAGKVADDMIKTEIENKEYLEKNIKTTNFKKRKQKEVIEINDEEI